jgi:polyferredoxin
MLWAGFAACCDSVRSATATALGTLGAFRTLHALRPLHAFGAFHALGPVGTDDAVAAPVLLPVGLAILAAVFTTDIPCRTLRGTVFLANVAGRAFRCTVCPAVFLANVGRRALGESHARGGAAQYDDRRYCCCDDAFLRQHGSTPFLENPSQGLDARP